MGHLQGVIGPIENLPHAFVEPTSGVGRYQTPRPPLPLETHPGSTDRYAGLACGRASCETSGREPSSPPPPRPQACRPSALSGAPFGPAGPFEPPMDSLRETSGPSRADRRTCRTARGERPGGRTGGTRGHGRSAGCPIPAGHMAFRQVAGIRRSTISAHQEQPAGIASSLKLYAGLCTAAVSPLPTRM